jgi:methylsterol monooxygenase/4-alpha-methyl-delta7-sterol-4alpha-methyl oxidase
MIHAHPIEYALGNILPSSFGVLMLGKRMHFSTYMAWGVVRTINSLDGHCGYDFTWVPCRLLPFKLDG